MERVRVEEMIEDLKNGTLGEAESSLVVKPKKDRWVAYFKSRPEEVGMGMSEEEALMSLNGIVEARIQPLETLEEKERQENSFWLKAKKFIDLFFE